MKIQTFLVSLLSLFIMGASHVPADIQLAQEYGSGAGFMWGYPEIGPPPCGASLPTVRAVGTVAANSAAVAPGLPSGTTSGDLLLMFCENANDGNLTASGWTEVTGSPIGNSGTRLTVLYRVATGTDATTTNDSGNHQLCRIIGITSGTYCSTAYFGEYNENTQAATGSVSISGVTTTENNGLIFQASAGDLPDATGTAQFSSAANSSLGSVTEQIDNTTNALNGGALFVMTGTMATLGTVNAGTVTAATTTALRANATIVVKGAS